MKKISYLSLLMIAVFCYSSNSQNLLNNPDFESYTSCPVGNSEIAKATNWLDVVFSSDYVNCVYPGWTPQVGGAQSGSGYAGFASYGNATGASESCGQFIISPLVAGETYTVSFWAKKATSGGYSSICDGVCVYGFIGNPAAAGGFTNFCTGTLPGAALLTCTDTVMDVNWQFYTKDFTASGNFDFIVFGVGCAFNCPEYVYIDNMNLFQSGKHNCLGDTTSFTLYNTAGLLGAQWDFGDPASGANNYSSIFTPTHVFTAPGTYTVEVIKYYLSSTDTVFIPVTIHAYPVVNLGNDTTFCTGSSFVLNADTGYYSYLWNNGSTNSNYVATVGGTYIVTVSDSLCASNDTIVLNEVPCLFPTALLSSSDTDFCVQNCIDFFDLSTNNPTSWQWFFPGANSTTSTLQNPTGICYNTSGSFDVTLIACNALGCDTLTFTNFIHADAIPSVNLGNDTLICLGDSVTLNAGAGFTTYLWSDNSTNQTLTVSSQGTYTVQINSGNCPAADTIIISTQLCATPFVALASSDTGFCEKNCINFFDLSTNNPTSWHWFFPGSDSLTSTLQNPSGICYNSYGSFDVTLIACNIFGCDTLILSNFITEYQSPVDSIYQSNDTLYSLQAYSYQWYEVTNGIIAGATNQYFVPQQAGSYYCIITDSVGCAGSSGSIVITGIRQLAIGSWQLAIVPNPFTGAITIKFQNQNIEKATLTVKNVLGQIVWSTICPPLGVRGSSGNGSLEIDLSFLTRGIYLLDVMMDDVRCVRKIVKD